MRWADSRVIHGRREEGLGICVRKFRYAFLTRNQARGAYICMHIYTQHATVPFGMRWGLSNEYSFEPDPEVIVEGSPRHTLKSQDHVRVRIALESHNVPETHRSAAMTEGFGHSGTRPQRRYDPQCHHMHLLSVLPITHEVASI